MLRENWPQIESLLLNLSLTALFILMGLAVHDVMKKNNVPLAGRMVAYGVLFLGAAGFMAKGIIQLFWSVNGL